MRKMAKIWSWWRDGQEEEELQRELRSSKGRSRSYIGKCRLAFVSEAQRGYQERLIVLTRNCNSFINRPVIL